MYKSKYMLVLLIFFIYGCDEKAAQHRRETVQYRIGEIPNGISSQVVKTKNGNIECIVFDGYRRGGLSCDWGNNVQN